MGIYVNSYEIGRIKVKLDGFPPLNQTSCSLHVKMVKMFLCIYNLTLIYIKLDKSKQIQGK